MKQNLTGGGGLNILYLPVSQDVRKKICDIHLSKLVLLKMVGKTRLGKTDKLLQRPGKNVYLFPYENKHAFPPSN